MLLQCAFVERTLTAGMRVRVDEAWDQILAAPVDAPHIIACSDVLRDLRDLSVADEDIGIRWIPCCRRNSERKMAKKSRCSSSEKDTSNRDIPFQTRAITRLEAVFLK